jgi:hypothetical protein
VNEKEHWITLKDGRHIKIDTSKYMNAKIRRKGKNKKDDEEKIIVYHGSQYDFDKFDMEKSKQNNQWSNNLEGH